MKNNIINSPFNEPLPKPQMPKITMDNSTAVACSCGSEIFQEGMKFRRVSKIVAGTKDDQMIIMPVIFCAKCSLELAKQ